ncbi:hypothetical protein KNP414_05245 [Paenibacillus mucilaginosus KNP414]|uniref:Uncharacterized protein n=1 Tax=Paenibacillus mucilaginosus (strain KNP414) TaxID=1036673 RepID=F8FC08_PAEMK|nr:hypothetical protein KNP414_05245 [Paenibacillus mucilaginosus KNP414]
MPAEAATNRCMRGGRFVALQGSLNGLLFFCDGASQYRELLV